MNDDFKHFSSSPDETDDPLLQALRQQLGEGFGQEPPARLWAGIRQRLPLAPRPWWRRPRRLLPLLLLLLLSAVAVWQVNWRHVGPAARPGQGTAVLPATHQPVAAAPATSGAAIGGADAGRHDLATSAATTSGTAAQVARATSLAQASAAHPTLARRSATPEISPAAGRTRSSAWARRKAAQAVARPAQPVAAPTAAGKPTAYEHGRRWRKPAAAGHAPDAAGLPPHQAARGYEPGSRTSKHEREVAATRRFGKGAGQPLTRLARLRASRQLAVAGHAELVPPGTPPGRAPHGQFRRATPAASSGAVDSLEEGRVAALTLLVGRTSRYRVSWPGLPVPLAATELAASPWLPPARRWAVQLLAGPALSYRSIRPAAGTGNLAYAAPSPTTNAPSSADSTGRVGLERAALGWGAQVQARRVLSGRWALAAGLGYHEYATALSLDVTTRTYSAAVGSVAATTLAVRQRDTYRVLTVPVQLGYALAPLRGRLALGVLGGLEPSLYLGGRTTERSSCACEQQEFTSAANSPYNAWSLALSLGLDMRYHLGGPASGWTLLVQPTGRYVASSFVRSPGWGYALRQPYSLGLLTGVAWEW